MVIHLQMVEWKLMPQDLDLLADKFSREHGRDAIGTAFHLAAKSLEEHDAEGYERYFRIYVRLAQRSGNASVLSAWHEQMSRQESEVNLSFASAQVG